MATKKKLQSYDESIAETIKRLEQLKKERDEKVKQNYTNIGELYMKKFKLDNKDLTDDDLFELATATLKEELSKGKNKPQNNNNPENNNPENSKQ